MAHRLGPRTVEAPLLEQPTDFPECTGEPGGIAGELPCRGVREPFAFTTNQTLNQAHQRQADASDRQKKERNWNERRSNLRNFFIENGFARYRFEIISVQRDTPDDRWPGKSVRQRHEPHVQPRVTIQDVTELVRNDALQFVARK